MNSNLKNLIYAISSIVIILPAIIFTSDYIYFQEPMNKATIIPNLPPTPNEFQNVRDEKDSTCYTTLSMNLFCYKKPKIHDGNDKNHLSSFIVGDNGINGELHFDRVGLDGGIFTIKNMNLIDDDSVLITFADKDYRIGNKDRTIYEIIEDFEFTTTVKKYDSFIAKCNNNNGSAATIVQFLGVTTIDDIDYFLTWHTVIVPEDKFQCKYPELIQHSLNHNFGVLFGH